jgi:hypothetical protein
MRLREISNLVEPIGRLRKGEQHCGERRHMGITRALRG